ncbi:interleukin-12 subunit beta [Microcaecilia unicolor]|uniref:Interleukin-12 subunit beta n=1 Tax=Microcaecilia unicolor TaxID=1415580 RepID=A0A6P7YYT8_9AMPH|nr:interleukin-12 subunit beta [Microcaecilia unicolor]
MVHSPFILLSLVLFAIPLEAVWKLKNNTYVVDIDMSRRERPIQTVILKCEASEKQKNSNIHWEQSLNHDKSNSKSRKTVGYGTEHQAHVNDFLDGGNFTCRNEKREVLHYSNLLINEIIDIRGANSKQILKEFLDTKTFFYCEAKTYSGNFTCYWQVTERKEQHEEMVVMQVEEGVRNVVCSHPSLDKKRSIYTTNCQEIGVCLHGEENQAITLVLHAIRGRRYENATTSIFIRNIVKPDPPQNLSIFLCKKSVTLQWEYPESWSTQHTFFPLTFKVRVEETGKPQKRSTHGGSQRKRSTEKVQYYNVDNTSLTLDQWNSRKTYHVQAKDCYGDSFWSNWSSFEHPIHQEKPGKMKSNVARERTC